MQNIIIDTDLGDDVDDVLAMAFALRRPELAVRAITTVCYDTHKRCDIVAQLLDSVDYPDIPFAPGISLPLHPMSVARRQELENPTAPYILNHLSATTGAPSARKPRADAVSLMAETVAAYPGQIGLVGIGPLTNIAAFLRCHPQLARQLQWIAVMGGELDIQRCEHNFAWDATAADIVMTSGIPLFVGTWSVTRKFTFSQELCAQIRSSQTPWCRYLAQCIEGWWPHKGDKPAPVMYDVAPLIWAFAPELYPTEEMEVRVETRGEHTLGMMRATWGRGARVSRSIDAAAVARLYAETICG